VIDEFDSIQLENVAAAGGSVQLIANGQITVLQVTAGGGGDVSLISRSGRVDYAGPGRIVADNDLSITAGGDILLGDAQALNGTAAITALTGDVSIGSLAAAADAHIAAFQGSIIDLENDASEDIRSGGTIALEAQFDIGAPTPHGSLDLAAGSRVTAQSRTGDIALRGAGDIELQHVQTDDGAIRILAEGSMRAIHVDASGTDRDENDVYLTSSGDVGIQLVRAGRFFGDIEIIAGESILDADPGGDDIDDVDVSGNDVRLVALSGNIGAVVNDLFKDDVDAIEVETFAHPGDPANSGSLFASASGSVAIHGNFAGDVSLHAAAAVLRSDDHLDTTQFSFNVEDLALIADFNKDGTGRLAVRSGLSVAGDLRLEGADIVSTEPSIELVAQRLLFVSGGDADLIAAVSFLDVTTLGDLRLDTTLSVTTLIDLNCEHVALQALDSSASLRLRAAGSVIVADDVIAGNQILIEAEDGNLEVASSGQVTARGNISLIAADDVVLNGAIAATESGGVLVVAGNSAADDDTDPLSGSIHVLAPITTDAGNILLQSSHAIGMAAPISSTSGSIGMSAGQQLLLQSSVQTPSGDLLLVAAEGIDMTAASSLQAGGKAIIRSGADLHLGFISATNVAMYAMGDILDINGPAAINVEASTLALSSGGSIGLADESSPFPDANRNAIDVHIDILAVVAQQGIYMQQDAGDLTVGNSPEFALSVSVPRLYADGLTTPVALTQRAASLDDVESMAGPVKLMVLAGSLTIEDGHDADGVGVVTHGANAILLHANHDLTVDASIMSDAGSITLIAGDDVSIQAGVSTGATGTIFVLAQDSQFSTDALSLDGMRINGLVVTESGDILLSSRSQMVVDSDIVSSTGHLGLVSVSDIVQRAQLLTGGDILVDAGASYQMRDGAVASAGTTLLARATSHVAIGRVSADYVAINAGEDILDVGADSDVDIVAGTASLLAGGQIGLPDTGNGDPDANRHALDLAVDTLAARSASSLYLEQVVGAGDLSVATAGPAKITVVVDRSQLSSTSRITEHSISSDSLSGLKSDSGSIKLVVRDGSLTIGDGSQPSIKGATAGGRGDVLLAAGVDLDIQARISSDGGHITLYAADDLNVSAPVETKAGGSLLLEAGNVTVDDEPSAVDGLLVQGELRTEAGDLFLRALGDVVIANRVTSTEAGVGIVAARDLTLNAEVSGQSVSLSAGGKLDMNGAASIQSGSLLHLFADSDIQLATLTAPTVVIKSGGSIFDSNGPDVVNVDAQSLQVSATGSIGQPDATAQSPDLNHRAIDLQVDRLAAESATGIYLQQLAAGRNLTIGPVEGQSQVLSVQQVQFNSSLLQVNHLVSTGNLQGLRTSDNGPIKVVVRGGGLSIEETLSGPSVWSAGAGDVLLRAANDLTVHGGVDAGSGHLALRAADDIFSNGLLLTSGEGTIQLVAENANRQDAATVDGVHVAGNIQSSQGDILVLSQADIVLAGSMTSQSGNIALLADSQIAQFGHITTNGDFLLHSVGDWNAAAPSVVSAGSALLVQVGGSMRLGLLEAEHISLDAAADILDANGSGIANIEATSLRLIAGGTIGGPDQAGTQQANANALDIQTVVVAAASARGIYLQQLAPAGDLRIGDVGELSASVTVYEPGFDSSLRGDSISRSLSGSSDLTTTSGGSIKVLVLRGSLIADEGSNGNAHAVLADGSGNILLSAESDVLINAQLRSAAGHIHLDAGDDIHISAPVVTAGDGTIYMVAANTERDSPGASMADGIQVSAPVQTQGGGILMLSHGVAIDAVIGSAGGDVAITADGDVSQAADVSAGSNALVSAGQNVRMSASARITATGDALVEAGQDIELSRITGSIVTLAAGRDILDNNGSDSVTVTAEKLKMFAGRSIGHADLENASPARNRNAIEVQVDTLAASSATGIYVRQLASATDLSIGSVEQTVFSVTVHQIGFNSSTSEVSESRSIAQLAGLQTFDGGNIKVRVEGGDLVLQALAQPGSTGIVAEGRGDILLSAAGDIITRSVVASGAGSLTLHSGANVLVGDGLSTAGSGTVYVRADRDVELSGNVRSAAGDLLIDARRDVHSAATMDSALGSMAVIAGRDIQLDGSLSTGADVALHAQRHLHMAPDGSVLAGDKALIIAGSASVAGDVSVGLVQAEHVSVDATGSILTGGSNNIAASTNFRATHLRLLADSDMDGVGGIGRPLHAINIEADIIAASSSEGIYLRQLQPGGDLRVGHVPAIEVLTRVDQVNFNSSRSSTNALARLEGLDDVETTGPAGPAPINQANQLLAIELQVERGDLTVTDGLDADGMGVQVLGPGNIRLATLDAGNIELQTGVRTLGSGDMGQVALDSAGWIDELSRGATALGSDATIVADRLELTAQQHVHLHRTQVNSVTSSVGQNGVLDQPWQQPNTAASDRGDDFLSLLGPERIEAARSNGGMTAFGPASDTAQRDTSVREAYDAIAEQFRFDDVYQRQYALFLQNTKSLNAHSVFAGSARGGDAPNIYMETLGPDADFNVAGQIMTLSNHATEGGIVLVAGGQFSLDGSLVTVSRLPSGDVRTQLFHTVGRGLSTDDGGQLHPGYLQATGFDGGEGVLPRDPLLTSTEFVIRDQNFGLSAGAEDYRTHVFQRVVMQFGFEGESGFVSYVGYADGEVQQFDVAGQEGVRTKSLNQLDAADQAAIVAKPSGTLDAAAFTRAIAFDDAFLDANQLLPTVAIIRRAADFFVFENAAAENPADIRDLTFEAFDIDNVVALGAQGATALPADPPLILPPSPIAVAPAEIEQQFVDTLPRLIEFVVLRERQVEIVIYRVFYHDENGNGQPEESELPSGEEILQAEVIEQTDDVPQVPEGKRIRLESVRAASGGAPTAEDIARLKAEYLNDPEQPSGAYAIILRNIDDQESVLDVFAIRDSASTGANEQLELDQGPLIVDPTTLPLHSERQHQDNESSGNETPEASSDRASEDAAGVPQPVGPQLNDGASNLRSFDRSAAGFAEPAALASALWFARMYSRQSASAPASATNQSDARWRDLTDIAFDRNSRRQRRWKRLGGQ
jgi:hypothetical protein